MDVFSYLYPIGDHLMDVESADAVLASLHRPQRRRGRVVALPERGSDGGHPSDVAHRRRKSEAVSSNRIRMLPDRVDRVERRVCR